MGGYGEAKRRLFQTSVSQGEDGGWCDCQPGYHGPACEQKLCPFFNGTQCSGNGICDGSTAKCKCNDNFFGSDCRWKHCPGFTEKSLLTPTQVMDHRIDYVECHGGSKIARGVCNYDVGECSCQSQFHGDSCEAVKCPQYNGKDCNGEGICKVSTQTHGETTQPKQWDTTVDAYVVTPVGPGGLSKSPATYTIRTPNPTQSLNTFPGFGRCECNAGFEGVACEAKKCPVSNAVICGGTRGACDQKTGQCICKYGYFGATCSSGSGAILDLP